MVRRVGDEDLPVVWPIVCEVGVDDLGVLEVAEAVETVFGILPGVNLPGVRDVQRVVHEGHAGVMHEALQDGLHRALAIRVGGNGADDAADVAAGEQSALVAPGHLARLRHAARPHGHLEARRHLDLGGDLLVIGLRRRYWLPWNRDEALLRLRLAGTPPIIRRMQPEIRGLHVIRRAGGRRLRRRLCSRGA